MGSRDISTISGEKSSEVWTSIDLDSELSIMNKTVSKRETKELGNGIRVIKSRAYQSFLCSPQDSYEMFVEMDKMDGEVDVKIKKKKKIKKKERLENMKKEMDIVSGRKFSRLSPASKI